MTKEQFIKRWKPSHMVITDLDAVISTEIEKAQEVEPEKAKPQPDFNPIEEAYERGDKIRMKEWVEGDWIQKYDETKCVSKNRLIQSFKLFSQKINTNPHEWELYTETEQVTDHVQHALNPIAEAYHNYKPIRYIDWDTSAWIKKHCDGYSIDEKDEVYKNDSIQFNFDESPQHWELYTEPTEQPVMTEKEKIDHILTNKLTWKPMGNKRFYANMFSGKASDGSRQVYFVDYNNPHSGYFETRIFNIDLSEWQPVETEKPSSQVKLDNSFDKERFEAMFRAVIETHEATMNALKQLDAYYASKEGGANV